MRFDVFYQGQFICHFPMYSFDVWGFLKEIEDHLEAEVTMDLYANRIELL